MLNLSSYLPAFLLFTFAASPCLDINIASKQDLEKIKHIGEVRAGQIIKSRETKLFSSLDELSRITGLGNSRISDIKEQGLACVSKIQPARAEVGPPPVINELADIKQNSRGFYPFLIALALAIFSGFVILILKKHVRAQPRQNNKA